MASCIICHLRSSLCEKTNGAVLGAPTNQAKYEATGTKLEDAFGVRGRITMEEQLAEDEPFASVSNRPAAP